jgi:hypothetical protein
MRSTNPGALAAFRVFAIAAIAAGATHAAALAAQETPKTTGAETAKQKVAETPTVAASPTATQAGAKPAKVKRTEAEKEERAKEGAMFFANDEPLVVTLSTDLKHLRRDKGDKAPWRSATLSYTDTAGKLVTIPTQVKTRGIWRLKNCDFPPVRFDFKRETTKGTLFHGLDKPKLTSYCRNDDTYEQHVLQELQLYRAYELLTSNSHKVRLLQVSYVDSASGKTDAKRYAFFYEEPDALASRLGTKLVKLKGATPDDLEPFHKALFGVFEYFIGNTDFSAFALHNVELLWQPDGTVIPVPYDFDFSGAVNARYATTDPKLTISRVRDRLFRGYCGDPEQFKKVFALFNEKKDPIYALYSDQVGKLMRPQIVKETLDYFNDFYKTINDSRMANREIIKACVDGH